MNNPNETAVKTLCTHFAQIEEKILATFDILRSEDGELEEEAETVYFEIIFLAREKCAKKLEESKLLPEGMTAQRVLELHTLWDMTGEYLGAEGVKISATVSDEVLSLGDYLTLIPLAVVIGETTHDLVATVNGEGTIGFGSEFHQSNSVFASLNPTQQDFIYEFIRSELSE